ncbi:MAG: ATP-binding protein [Candidatus Omnitrophica bacterium]|nr:ATP-binding protein [Candidatus Omnitrophota bacterium]
MIDRKNLYNSIKKTLDWSRALAILGPRQCGKTTLARQFVSIKSGNYFDLESVEGLSALQDPQSALSPLKGLVVIDEVQRRPDLFPVLRVLLDREPLPAQFLILGSASPALLRQSSESLAGRLALMIIAGFGLDEIDPKKINSLWLRGGFPLSFLAENDEASFNWRKNFVQLFIDRDLREQGIDIPTIALYRFWNMLAHSHGQIWNAAPFAASLGVSQHTVRRYLDILTDTYMIRQLPPWHVNIKKRQVKSPKIYFRDIGLLNVFLGLQNEVDILRHPQCGFSWEGFVIEQLIRILEIDYPYFWATHQGAEIDLVFNKGGQMYGVEIKRQDAPRMTPSIKHALEDLMLERIAVIYPGSRRYSIHKQVDVVPFDEIQSGMRGLFATGD